jgi:hypothetical protein
VLVDRRLDAGGRCCPAESLEGDAMATRRTTFDKLQRERAKKAKAAAKRERRQEKGDDEEQDALDLSSDEELTPGELIARIEAVHQRYADGKMSLEDFEEQKTELLTRLSLLPI